MSYLLLRIFKGLDQLLWDRFDVVLILMGFFAVRVGRKLVR